MPRCATCRLWSTDDETIGWTGPSIGMRPCRAVRQKWTIMDEANNGQRFADENAPDEADALFIKNRIDALKAAKAYVQDASEYFAQLVTGPDYSCVLHSPR